ncbi:SDR family NAD(P)-dependent oxidoreductase [Halioxenophilus aromaticivorans]|uniref:SDR family oxidoreductase n=1 Tax=Halioxenophilus aromaticivorans TaxID=1306992 RepID=A0AAV3U7Q6_9ALTE
MSTLPQTPSFSLYGKRAMVTGAGRGIGAGLSVALAAAGAQVTLVARTEPEIAKLAEAINSSGGLADYKTLDVSNHQAVASFFEQEPAYDVLVNNAGTNRPKSILEVTEDDYDAVLDLNLKSLVFTTQAAIRKMVAIEKAASIIHIGSQMGHVGGPNRTLYCASKWALEGFNKALALDVAAHGIRSNIIAPTFIETPMTKPFFENQEFLQSVLAKIKLGRLGTVEDLMGAVVFLACDASALMTGTTLLIDGGWTAE